MREIERVCALAHLGVNSALPEVLDCVHHDWGYEQGGICDSAEFVDQTGYFCGVIREG